MAKRITEIKMKRSVFKLMLRAILIENYEDIVKRNDCMVCPKFIQRKLNKTVPLPGGIISHVEADTKEIEEILVEIFEENNFGGSFRLVRHGKIDGVYLVELIEKDKS